MPQYPSDCSIIDKITPIPTPEDIVKNRALDISANTKILQWETAEDFMNNMNGYIPKKDESDNLTSHTQETWLYLNNMVLNDREKTLSSEDASDYTGSNANWGRITQPYEIQGGTIDEPQMYRVNTLISHEESRDIIKRHSDFNKQLYDRIYEAGELTAPLVKAMEEQEDAESEAVSSLLCKGCSKIFATKASLKRHHERKRSCRDICEKLDTDLSENTLVVPEKPYIVEWIDNLMTLSISADSDKPYCKHCDVEFANKSNLNKHLSKSVACDKLAKEEFIKLLRLSQI